jgi:hypothetical protein
MYTNKVIWYTKTAILIFKATQPILWKAMFNFKPIFFWGGGEGTKRKMGRNKGRNNRLI